MKFLGIAKFLFLMTYSAPKVIWEGPQGAPSGKECLPDVPCTLYLYYRGTGDIRCSFEAHDEIDLVKNRLFIVWYGGTPAGADDTYVLFMADPDAPDPCNENGFRFHWVTEATFTDKLNPLTYGVQDLLSYSPPNPGNVTKAHRYQIMMYKVKKTAITALNGPLVEYAKSRLPGTPLSRFLSPLGLKNDEPPLATAQFCFTMNVNSPTCLQIGFSLTTQGPSTTMPDGGPPQASTISTTTTTSTNATTSTNDTTSTNITTTITKAKPLSADSRTVKSVFLKTTLVLVYSVVLGWMNS